MFLERETTQYFANIVAMVACCLVALVAQLPGCPVAWVPCRMVRPVTPAELIIANRSTLIITDESQSINMIARKVISFLFSCEARKQNGSTS
jgi:hypothetical protein